jgi:uncharacterized membrane protein YdbT with pleckstrin-like domain
MSETYLKKILGSNEKIRMQTRQHWSVLIRDVSFEVISIIAIIVLVSLVLALIITGPWLVILYGLIIFPFISAVWDVLEWYNHRYIITNRRVIQIFGVLNKNITDSSLEKVNDIKMEQPLFGRLLGYGNIEILTASELGINRFTRIAKPIEFKSTMLNAKEDMDHLERGFDGFEQAEIAHTLNQISRLHEQGKISTEEFNRIKESLVK